MILNDSKGTALRVGDIRTIHRILYTGYDEPRYNIELRFKHATGSLTYYYKEDKELRDADFDKMNRYMDALDGIQQ